MAVNAACSFALGSPATNLSEAEKPTKLTEGANSSSSAAIGKNSPVLLSEVFSLPFSKLRNHLLFASFEPYTCEPSNQPVIEFGNSLGVVSSPVDVL